MLSTSQLERHQELKDKIKAAEGRWKVALDKDEQIEYKALNDSLKPQAQEKMFPKSFVIGMLDEIYDFVKEGNHRSKILRLKVKLDKF